MFKRIRDLERNINKLTGLCSMQSGLIQELNVRILFMERDLGIERPTIKIPPSYSICPRNG